MLRQHSIGQLPGLTLTTEWCSGIIPYLGMIMSMTPGVFLPGLTLLASPSLLSEWYVFTFDFMRI